MSGLLAGAACGLAAWLTWTLAAQMWFRGLRRGVIWQGPPGHAAVALTFDDGPDPGLTPAIAGVLERAGARGTFFVVAQRLKGQEGLVRQLVRRGHEVALHGYTHRHLWLQGPAATLRQVAQGVRAIEAAAGVRPRYYRPPWGHFNLGVGTAVRREGLRVVLWSAAPPDWKAGVSPHSLARALAAALRPGAIIDLHDAASPQAGRGLLEALPAALEAARSRGLACVTLSELLGAGGVGHG